MSAFQAEVTLFYIYVFGKSKPIYNKICALIFTFFLYK
eukprot:UN28492